MKRLLLVIDVPLLQINNDRMKNYMNKNLTFVWTERGACDRALLASFRPVDIICGLINGGKSIRGLRKNLKKDPELMKYPVVLIDDHSESLITGQFDMAVDLQHFKCNEISVGYYDFDRMIELLETFRIEWYMEKDIQKPIVFNNTAKWNNI